MSRDPVNFSLTNTEEKSNNSADSQQQTDGQTVVRSQGRSTGGRVTRSQRAYRLPCQSFSCHGAV